MTRAAVRLRLTAAVTAGVAIMAVPLAAGPAQAAPVTVNVTYVHRHYEVQFKGTVSPDGPKGYTIKGTFHARCAAGALTTQYVTFGYGPASKGWFYKTLSCDSDDLPAHMEISGNRPAGDKIDLQVGATSGVGNTWQYGDKVVADIGN
ncbi:hypothetical protein [Streptomyces sp. PanSC9]|uniref:hypothetical protein n=1 Tax=Streptomyces sp. PanSC9 TaxID=1520461 RepID=UPI000F90B240|nr:hypothetical protein [Streptomyces sp. PanSC9]ROP48031.1 hypothetical protein EDD94_7765 [Streptomyces sp. PanSC9]